MFTDKTLLITGGTGSFSNAVLQYCAAGVAYKLKNLYGKWCRPKYNSVTATFCYDIARNLPIQISNPANDLNLMYIGDMVIAFVGEVEVAVGQRASRRYFFLDIL